MTKLRPPLSIEAALARIAGHLPGGFDDMGRIVDLGAGTVRAWGDPDRREIMPIDHAIALDLAYRQAGGDGAPIFEAYAQLLDAAGINWFADQAALARQGVTVIRECSEAEVALIQAAQPGASPADRAVAYREAEEAIDALRGALPMLTGAAPSYHGSPA